MGRIITPVTITNALDPGKEVRCEVFVDTDASHLVLPKAWKDRLGLPVVRSVEAETADQRVVSGDLCGPVRVLVEGFEPVHTDAIFIDMESRNGSYEPLLGYLVLEAAGIVVDMIGHRLVKVRALDLKRMS